MRQQVFKPKAKEDNNTYFGIRHILCQHMCECSTAKVIIKLTFNNTRVSIKANPCEHSFTWFSIGSYSTDTNLV